MQIIALRAMTSEETARILAHGRQRVPSPLQCQTMARADVREFLGLFGNVGLDALGSPGCKASVEGFRGSVPRERAYEPMAGWTDCRGAGIYNWATYFEEPWKVGPGYISNLEMSMRLERSVWANHLWESYHKCWHGLPYPQNPRST